MSKRKPTPKIQAAYPGNMRKTVRSDLSTSVVETTEGPLMLLAVTANRPRGGTDYALARLTLAHVRELQADLREAEGILAQITGEAPPVGHPVEMMPGNFQVVAGFDEAGAWHVGVKFTMPGREDMMLRLDEAGAAILARDVTGACEAIRQHQNPAKH